MKLPILTLSLLLSLAAPLAGQQRFADNPAFRSLKPGPVNYTPSSPLAMPFILWGGDVATHHANGGLTTTKDSIFGKAGLNVTLVPADDPVQAAADYVGGKTPFFRCTLGMGISASEVLNMASSIKGRCILQKTWSTGGDNAVGRDHVKTLANLKGATVCLQQGGPHVELLWDLLQSQKLGFTDVTIRWAATLTGDGSPADLFRRDQSIDVAFVITPDLFALCGDYDGVGDGTEGTVQGAHRVTGTQEFRRSIADVYLVREDFYQQHPDVVMKVVNSLLKAYEDLTQAARTPTGPVFTAMLERSRGIWGKEIFPTLDDIRGFVTGDCSFVGFPGNQKFFTDRGPEGFEALQGSRLDMVTALGVCKTRSGFLPSGFDYSASTLRSGLTMTDVQKAGMFRAEAVTAELEGLAAGTLDERTLLPPFTINFEPDQEEFVEAAYGTEFQQAGEMSGKMKGAVIMIRAHADPALVLKRFIDAGFANGRLKRTGSPGNYRYFLDGQPFDLSQSERIRELIASGAFEPPQGSNLESPRDTVQAALSLSKRRAEAVKQAVLAYAKANGLEIDETQVTAVGAGVAEPLIPVPNAQNAWENRRVEFRVVKVSAEAMTAKDFDF